jgi:hypothetical protein
MSWDGPHASRQCTPLHKICWAVPVENAQRFPNRYLYVLFLTKEENGWLILSSQVSSGNTTEVLFGTSDYLIRKLRYSSE